MDLIDTIVKELGVEEMTAESSLGAIFTSLRMSLDADTFADLEREECRIAEWVGKTVIGGGRTGEMLALVGPDALARNLGAAGLSPEQSTRVIEIVAGKMQECLPENLATRIRDKMSLAV